MSNQEMSVEERNLISVAYKNAVGSRRASGRIISSVGQKEASKGTEQANPAGIGRVVARNDLVGLHDVRQFEKLTHFAHFLHDGVVAALFFTDTSPFLDGLQPVDVIGPHRG